jgi:hypothetical protein
MAGAESSFVIPVAQSSGSVGADMELVERKHSHQESRKEQIPCQY